MSFAKPEVYSEYTPWLYTLQPGLVAIMALRDVFAVNLKALRQAKGLTQETLAGLAEIDRTYVSLLERCEYSASLDLIEKLAEALQTDAWRMLLPTAASHPDSS